MHMNANLGIGAHLSLTEHFVRAASHSRSCLSRSPDLKTALQPSFLHRTLSMDRRCVWTHQSVMHQGYRVCGRGRGTQECRRKVRTRHQVRETMGVPDG